MSYSQQQQRQLSQEQSKIADNLPWSEEKTKWKESRNGKKYPLKWRECTFDSAGLEAVQMFHELNLAEKERILSSSGLYTYGVGKDRLFQSKPFTARKRTPEEQQQLEEDRAGLEGSRISYSDGAKKGHEENVKMHQEYMKTYEERMAAWEEYKQIRDADLLLHRESVDVTNQNNQLLQEVLQELRSANRLKQIELGQSKE